MIVIDEIESASNEGWGYLSGRIRVGRRPERVWFRWPGPACPTPADVLLLAVLRTASRRGEDIRLEGVASPRLLANLPRILGLYRAGDPHLSHIDVKTDTGPMTPARGAVESRFNLHRRCRLLLHLPSTRAGD